MKKNIKNSHFWRKSSKMSVFKNSHFWRKSSKMSVFDVFWWFLMGFSQKLIKNHQKNTNKIKKIEKNTKLKGILNVCSKNCIKSSIFVDFLQFFEQTFKIPFNFVFFSIFLILLEVIKFSFVFYFYMIFIWFSCEKAFLKKNHQIFDDFSSKMHLLIKTIKKCNFQEKYHFW